MEYSRIKFITDQNERCDPWLHSLFRCSTMALLVCQFSFSQTDSLADVFPLAIGNAWTYQFYYNESSVSLQGFSRNTRSGSVRYAIEAMVSTPDSVRWIINEKFNLTIHWEQYPPAIDSIYQDTTTRTFVFVERLDERHQLYRDSVGITWTYKSVYEFTRDFTDTTMILRYRAVGADGLVKVFSCPPHSAYNYHRFYQFKRNVGITGVQGGAAFSYSGGGWSDTVNHTLVNSTIVSAPILTLPQGHYLIHQNYPNPFNPTTTIEFFLPRSEYVVIKVYNLLGQELASLVSAYRPLGNHKVVWDAAQHPSGVYICRMVAGEYVGTKAMVLIK